jgi:phage terminase Nu1 subunit (DNA packaging protein)
MMAKPQPRKAHVPLPDHLEETEIDVVARAMAKAMLAQLRGDEDTDNGDH